MKKFMFLSLVVAVFAISCGGDEPGVDAIRPDIEVPAPGSDDEMKIGLAEFYNQDPTELKTKWADSALVDDVATLHKKVLLAAVGTRSGGPEQQATFIALFIGEDNNIGYGVAPSAEGAIDKAIGKDGNFLTSWDPRKIIYKDQNRVKISWLSRVAIDARASGGPNGEFPGVTYFNEAVGVSGEVIKNGGIASTTKYVLTPYAKPLVVETGGTLTPRPGTPLALGIPVYFFIYEGVKGEAVAPEIENPTGGVSPQRRAWAWGAQGIVDPNSTQFDDRYAYRLIVSEELVFGYAPSDKGQSISAYPFSEGTPGIILADGDVTHNNRSPLGKQVFYRNAVRPDNDLAISASEDKGAIMLTTVVADSVRLHNSKAKIAGTESPVILLEFPAFSGLDAIFDGYTDAVDFPGYKDMFSGFTADNPPTISADFGKDKVDGLTFLEGKDYATMKVPFLLLDTVVVE